MAESDPNAGQTVESSKKTIIIGLSGPSSSGKTTLARLLRTIFEIDGRVRTFIIHEDDFYYPDDK
jgi:nicotinamide/nicotinate riboside kinase